MFSPCPLPFLFFSSSPSSFCDGGKGKRWGKGLAERGMVSIFGCLKHC